MFDCAGIPPLTYGLETAACSEKGLAVGDIRINLVNDQGLATDSTLSLKLLHESHLHTESVTRWTAAFHIIHKPRTQAHHASRHPRCISRYRLPHCPQLTFQCRLVLHALTSQTSRHGSRRADVALHLVGKATARSRERYERGRRDEALQG